MKQNSYPRPGILRTTLYPNDFKRNVTSYHAMSILLKIKDRKVLILGDTRLTRDYWHSTAPALPLFERIELQWRLEMLRHETVSASVWQALAAQGEQLLEMADDLTL